jgi:hyperosmotically inducible periplasmic protein
MTLKGRLVSGTLACVLSLGLSLFAGQAPDNTKVNKPDRTQPTADQQKGNKADIEITRDIRRAITKDKNLSSYAKNIKIITQNGNVTLRGPVRSEEDKKAIETKANEVAGATHVKSEIEIASKRQKKQMR